MRAIDQLKLQKGESIMEKLQLVALIQAYTGVGIGLMVGLGALGACVGVGIMCSASSRARRASRR